jgi:hypothetical protein
VSLSRRAAWAAAAAAAAALLAGSVSGCSQMDAALGKQWVQVTFRQNITVTQLLRIQAACSHIPNVTAYPFPKHVTELDLQAGVRYNTTSASDSNVAQLQQCLQKFPAVVGFTPMDTGDEGD